MKKKNQKIQFGRLQIVIAMFLVLIAVLYFVQRNVSYSAREKMILPLSESEFGHAEVDTDADVLILWEEDANGVKGRDLMEDILQQMRIPYELCGGKEFAGEMLEGYSSVLLSVFDKGIITRHLKNGANLHQTTPDRRYWGKLKAAVFARYGRSPLGAALFWLSRRPPADPGHSIRKV